MSLHYAETLFAESLKKYIFQMDNIADEINIGDDTDKIKKRLKIM